MLVAYAIVSEYENAGFIVVNPDTGDKSVILEFDECQAIEKLADNGLIEIQDETIDLFKLLSREVNRFENARVDDVEEEDEDEENTLSALTD